MIIQKSWVKQLFCKHTYVKATRNDKFFILSGDVVYTVCEKCGKIKSKEFIKDEQ